MPNFRPLASLLCEEIEVMSCPIPKHKISELPSSLRFRRDYSQPGKKQFHDCILLDTTTKKNLLQIRKKVMLSSETMSQKCGFSSRMGENVICRFLFQLILRQNVPNFLHKKTCFIFLSRHHNFYFTSIHISILIMYGKSMSKNLPQPIFL